MAKRTVLVTGGNAGIGRALAELLVAEHGCRVIITSRSEEKGRRAVAEIGGESAEYLLMDATDDASVGAAAARLRARGVRLYALVNNAGVGLQNVIDLEMTDLQRTRLIVDTNFYGVIRSTDAFLDLIDEGGRVVNVSSGLGSAWLRTRDARARRLFSGTGTGEDALTLDALKAAVEDAIRAATAEDHFASLGKLGYGLSKAAVTALTLLHAREHEGKLVFASLVRRARRAPRAIADGGAGRSTDPRLAAPAPRADARVRAHGDDGGPRRAQVARRGHAVHPEVPVRGRRGLRRVLRSRRTALAAGRAAR